MNDKTFLLELLLRAGANKDAKDYVRILSLIFLVFETAVVSYLNTNFICMIMIGLILYCSTHSLPHALILINTHAHNTHVN